jgi:hypothetical protein
MDRRQYIEALRVVVRSPSPADVMEEAEWHTREYFEPEIRDMKEEIKGILKDIKTAAIEGEDWNLIEDYIKSCSERLDRAFESLRPE